MTHVMIDLETWSTRPNAAISQIGAVRFELKPKGKVVQASGFSSTVKLQDGFSVDNGTVAFWMQQGAAAKTLGQAMESQSVLLYNALIDFKDWLDQSEFENIWAWPANFDFPILANAYAAFGMEPPWNHRQTRCARTLAEAMGWPEVDQTGFTHHDALDDCVVQAMRLVKGCQR